MKKSVLIGLSATAVTIGVAGLAGIASAQTATTGSSSLVDKIATKFNLKKADVQAVFDADRSERIAQRETEVKTKLDAAVKAGTITQTQEDQLIAKQKEMRTFMESLNDKTGEERRTAMKEKMDEFKQWLTDNKIPDSVIKEVRGLGGFGGRGHGCPGSPGEMKTDDESTSSNQ